MFIQLGVHTLINKHSTLVKKKNKIKFKFKGMKIVNSEKILKYIEIIFREKKRIIKVELKSVGKE